MRCQAAEEFQNMISLLYQSAAAPLHPWRRRRQGPVARWESRRGDQQPDGGFVNRQARIAMTSDVHRPH